MIGEKHGPTSFAELAVQPEVSAEELIDILSDYALTGAAISADTVISIIDRTDITPAERKQLIEAAQQGVAVQGENRFFSAQATVRKEQSNYEAVVQHLSLGETEN